MGSCVVDNFHNHWADLSFKTDYTLKRTVSDNEFESEFVHDGKKLARQLIGAALQKHISAIDTDECEAGAEDAFFVADLGEVYRQHLRWREKLPRVTPHYAVKCNPDPKILQLLARLGAGFDCASKTEIEQVLAIGVQPSRIIYAQPCKTKSYLRFTAKQGVRQMTFDNIDELYKIKELFPTAQLFLRISTDDSASLCRLSQKFGASMDVTNELLRVAHQLELDVVGVAFHVGSGASDPGAFRQAVRDARAVFDAAAKFGFVMRTLDCGGGFVSETFDDMAPVLAAAVDEHFPSHVRIIAEPGRYYTSSAFTLACNVIARRTVEDKAATPEAVPATVAAVSSTSYMLYMNDGVYGNFSSIIFDHQHPVPRVLRTRVRADGYRYSLPSSGIDSSASPDSGYTSAADDEDATKRHSMVAQQLITYSIWGPTCDGIDCISSHWQARDTVNVGDWLYFDEMGAYTKCSATRFNGFTDKHETVYVCSEPDVQEILDM